MLRINTSHHHQHQHHHHHHRHHHHHHQGIITVATNNTIATALFYTVLLLLTMGAYSRPVERNERSSDEVLMGVDFLSIMLNPNADGLKQDMVTATTTPATHPNTPQRQQEPDRTISIASSNILSRLSSVSNKPTNTKTTSDDLKSSTTPKSTLSTSTKSLMDAPSTRKDGTVKRQVVTFVTTTEKPPTIVPITLLSLEINTEVYIGNNRPSKNDKQSVLVQNPTAINVESKKSDFGVELSEPITLENTRNANQNDGSSVPEIKPEEIIARGGNPDYIAQQIARIHKDRQQEPYNAKRSPGRARAVSYSSVVQVLPHRSTRPLDQQNTKPVETNIYSVPFDRGGPNYNVNSPDYDYTQIQPDSLSGKNASGIDPPSGVEAARQSGSLGSAPLVDPTVESKEYFSTRKYVPGDYNDSRQKQFYHRPAWSQQHQVYNKSYEQPEQNWGVPESNYEQQEEPQDARGVGVVAGGGGSRSQSEVNYEIDEASSVLSNGRIHGVQRHHHHHQQPQQEQQEQPAADVERKGETASQPVDDSQKIGYVVEGRNYKKYRVEERTADGFIVGEYGVVSNNDGSLRGVRYTADGTINPRLIYDALMKFLSL